MKTDPEWLYNDLINQAKIFKNQIIEYCENDIRLKITCIPDIVDRVEWFCDDIHISASYAKILIERSING